MSDPLAEILSRISQALDNGGSPDEIRPLFGELTSECRRLSEADRERRRRSDALEALLPTLAQAHQSIQRLGVLPLLWHAPWNLLSSEVVRTCPKKALKSCSESS